VLAAALTLAAVPSAARAQGASPHAIDIPPWFTESFLDFREDVRDAARDGRRLMIYFGQDGCPYCTALMKTNFSQRTIVDKTKKNFVAIALNIFGDRETTWIDGRTLSEKALARSLDVQFTPTLLFLDEKGAVIARLNGYYPPHKFEAVLDYVAEHRERKISLGAWLARNARDAASPRLADEPFFLAPPPDLRRRPGGKPLLVLFETPYCGPCDEMHREGFKREKVRALLSQFDVARFALGATTRLTTPAGDAQNRARVGRCAPRHVHADDRLLRHRRSRGLSHRRVPAAVPSRIVARLRRERRVSGRAFVPALHSGARRAAARERGERRDLEVTRSFPSRARRKASSSPSR
jgi:thioredoxin-related protein